MQQRITVEMLRELTEEQKERLREWWKPQVGDFAVSVKGGNLIILGAEIFQSEGRYFDLLARPGAYDHPTYMSKTKLDILPLLSIGQCLELLNDKTNEHGLQFYNATCDWHVWLGNYTKIDAKYSWTEDEIIQALWQAVKAVLA